MEQTAVKKLELKLLGIISFESEELRKKYKDAIEQAKQILKEHGRPTCPCKYNGSQDLMIEEAKKLAGQLN